MSLVKAYGICLYKKTKNSYKILLCQSIDNADKWGFLKGTKRENETPRKAAVREFSEESGINIDGKKLEDFFYQKNNNKDVGIFMLDGGSIKNLDTYFDKDKLKKRYICAENGQVRFFDIEDLPKIKTKQQLLVKKVLLALNAKK
jgi:ADP-ribose pyrophosphatase YjhB (NUDIX family)